MNYPNNHSSNNHDDLFTNDNSMDFSDLFGINLDEKQFKTKVIEDENQFILKIQTIGFDLDEINIYIEYNKLIIEGKRQDIIDEENEIYIKQENNYSFCQNSFSLEGINKSEIKATKDNDLIYIHLPKIMI